MQQHVCINMFLSLYLILFLIKLLFPKFKFPQNAKLITFSYFKNMQNLGCYNSTPLKMNLVLEIRETSTKDRDTPSLDSPLLTRVVQLS